MAETKKKPVDETEKTTEHGKIMEPKYTVQEIIEACGELFSCSREVAVVALKKAKENALTVDQARDLINEFLNKEVK